MFLCNLKKLLNTRVREFQSPGYTNIVWKPDNSFNVKILQIGNNALFILNKTITKKDWSNYDAVSSKSWNKFFNTLNNAYISPDGGVHNKPHYSITIQK